MKSKSIVFLLSSLCLASCGGGGSNTPSKSATDASSATSKSSVASSIASSVAASSAAAADERFSPVVGVYSAKVGEDESYLYISPAGKITAYNYLQDGKDLGSNCYRVATGSDTNVALNNKVLTVNGSNLEVSLETNIAGWILDADKKPVKVFYRAGSSELSAGGTLSTSDNGKAFVISTKKITVPTIEDITSSICK